MLGNYRLPHKYSTYLRIPSLLPKDDNFRSDRAHNDTRLIGKFHGSLQEDHLALRYMTKASLTIQKEKKTRKFPEYMGPESYLHSNHFTLLWQHVYIYSHFKAP